MAPTIPAWQCGAGKSCLQKNQIGILSLVIVKFQVGIEFALTLGSGIKTQPESKPVGMGSQGSVNKDWVMLWFPGAPVNSNVIVVPLVALMLLGMNWKMPPGSLAVAPTLITWL